MAHRSPIPDPVHQAIEVWLRQHDSRAPGLIEGLYLVGSTVLDDWHPGSDIDIIALCSRLPRKEDVDALRAAHLATIEEAGGVDIDGPRLVWADVAAAPTELLRPWTLHGEFHHDEGCFELNPVMWRMLAAHGRPARGPEPAEIEVFDNPADLQSFVRNNTDEYWRSIADAVERASQDPARTAFKAEMTSWCVLGVARMLYTARTGDVTSKTRAGLWLAEELPEHRALVEHAVSIRRGAATTPDTRETAVATAGLMRTVVALVVATTFAADQPVELGVERKPLAPG